MANALFISQTAMHCCKQCVHFDTSRQFECTQPIPERIAKKRR